MSGLYTRLVSGLLFLPMSALGITTARPPARPEDSQWWPRERIEALQLDRLRALLTHAREHVPHYRESFARIGFDRHDRQSVLTCSACPSWARRRSAPIPKA